MRNSWKIFFNDIKNISTDLVTAVIIGGLIFLPSLYAWLNITASWDPYGQTDQLPIGVVNEDIGEVIRDERIHVGDDLVATLKDNDSMDWRFMDRSLAMEQLEKGDLFAFIVIPKDFSKKLGTVVKAHPEKANVEYYVNEKINAIAPKITEKGASVIVEDISSNFISTVNGIIFNLFNEIGLELEKELPDIKKFEQYVFEIEERLPDIYDTLDGSLTDVSQAQTIVQKAKKELPRAEDVIDNGLEAIDEVTTFIGEAENRFNKLGPTIETDLANAQKAIEQVNSFITQIEEADIDFNTIDSELADLQNRMDESINYLATVEKTLQSVLDNMKNADEPNEEHIEAIDTSLKELQQINDILISGKESSKKVAQFINDYEAEMSQLFDEISDLSVRIDGQLDRFIKEYNETIEPAILAEITQAKNTLSNARDLLVDVQDTIPHIEKLLHQTGNRIQKGEEIIEEVLAEYPYINDKVTELANRIRNLQAEADINDIIELLQNDPEAEKGFFAEPVQLSENKIFPIENYGSGMTPFYTVLSLWVGGLLLISLLSTTVLEPKQFNIREIYFGKLFTFVLIGVLQTLIVTTGDILLIQVNVANPVLFVLFGIFCSIIFMTIIYSFVSIFGDVGKAIAIIMLVLQIAGSGGTYPVALLPKFFQSISPFLPFTYAVDLMREAVGGIVWGNVLFDLMMLAIFGIIAILIGSFLKEPINRVTSKLMGESKDTGVFH